MSLRNSTIPNDQRLAVVRDLIRTEARANRFGRPTAVERHRVLKSLAAELDARLGTKKAEAIEALDQKIAPLLDIEGSHMNDTGRLVGLALTVIRHWPFIRAALESYRESNGTDQ